MFARPDLPPDPGVNRYPAVRPDDVTWHPEMVSLVLQGRSGEALRLYRARTGGPANEARAAVAALEQGLPMQIRKSALSEGTSEEADVLNLLRQGKRALAAQLYGASTGTKPGPAAEAVERLAVRHEISPSRTGCLGILACVLASVAIEWGLIQYWS